MKENMWRELNHPNLTDEKMFLLLFFHTLSPELWRSIRKDKLLWGHVKAISEFFPSIYNKFVIDIFDTEEIV